MHVKFPHILFFAGVSLASAVHGQNAVGIGDVSFTPNYLLHIHRNAASGVLLQLSNTSTGNTAADGFQVNLNGVHVEMNNTEAGDIRFFTSNTERMRLDASGNLGIGLNPGQRLDVSGNVQFSGALMPGSTAGTSGQLLSSAGAGVAPTWVNRTAVVQIVNDLQGAVNTAYTNNTVTYSNSLIANSFSLTTPGYYEFKVFLGTPITTVAVGMNFRLQNITGGTTIDGPYLCQFPDPSFGDYGAPIGVSLYYNKTTTTAETIQVQWAATTAGGTSGVQAAAGTRTARIVVYRFPN